MKLILFMCITVSLQASILHAACSGIPSGAPGAPIPATSSAGESAQLRLARERGHDRDHDHDRDHNWLDTLAAATSAYENQTNLLTNVTTSTNSSSNSSASAGASAGSVGNGSAAGTAVGGSSNNFINGRGRSRSNSRTGIMSGHTHDLGGFRLEYNKYKILSHLGITENLDEMSPTIDDDSRQKLLTTTQFKEMSQQSGTGSRHKRSLTCDQVKSDKSACCLENFYVNFTHIGWDKWILYPAGYNANYCRGQCDLSHTRYYHSTLLSKYSNVISLCCSPKQMAPLRLLYIDEENKVHQKSIPDMVVESCDCA